MQTSSGLQKELEKHFSRQEFRRAAFGEVGTIRFPARAAESYAQDLLGTLDIEAIRARGFRIVVDYGYSPASFVLPLVLGPLGVEAVAARPYVRRATPAESDSISRSRSGRPSGSSRRSAPTSESSSTARRSGCARGRAARESLRPELGCCSSCGSSRARAAPDSSPSRHGHEPRRGGRRGHGLEVERTPASLARADARRDRGRRHLRRLGDGRLRLPGVLPGYDAVASALQAARAARPDRAAALGARRRAAEAELVAPRGCRARGAEGLVMRSSTSSLEAARSTCSTGVKVFDERGWVQILPDPDEPLVHLYAEGATEEGSAALAEEFTRLVEAIVQGMRSSGEPEQASSGG